MPSSNEATGTNQLPLSRIKKIIGTDQDINMCSNNAAFVITLATEMFIQYMAESGHNVVKSERKPRRNIQYRDLSSAVSHVDNLEFLSDIIPRTVPLKIVKANAHLPNTLIPSKYTVPPTTHSTSTPTNSHADPSSYAGPSHAGPSNPNTYSPSLDTAPPRVSVSGLLDSASSFLPGLNRIYIQNPHQSQHQTQAQPQPQQYLQSQSQPQNYLQPHSPPQPQLHPTHPSPNPIPNPTPTIHETSHPNPHPHSPPHHHTNGFTPTNKPNRKTSSGATEDEDPNAQLRMESLANDDDYDDDNDEEEEEEEEDVEMS
ncbi:hypothetical protein SBOR_3731 [Sclerotinia borealis F-4128]|uniref:Transcription factor CBF/NF-Y/archaeal histone domain-containing protein n=1 Tax=Sclerotinia borealis (strain F-4128) TaxID=1432307 RepID=W9CIV3_SCLBF|nr:hypothetical protein SBOR_3731 [Sclerotinia borealis F-4128]